MKYVAVLFLLCGNAYALTPTPTSTPTPCGQTYYEDFSAYPTATSLFANPPSYQGVTGSVGGFSVQTGLGGQVAQDDNAGGWSHAKFVTSTSYVNYIDLTFKCNASGGRTNFFFNTSGFDGSSIPTDGYYVQILPGISPSFYLYRDGPNTRIRVIAVTIANAANFTFRFVDNFGNIDCYIDGAKITSIRDTTYTGGFWGFGELSTTNAQFTNILEVDNSCLPTNTPTFTPVPTPTPAFIVTPCGTPFGAVFTPNPTPLAIPTMSWEGACMVEPSVIKCDADGLYHMTYSANAFASGSQCIGLMTSPTGLPGTWTRYGTNPALGIGFGGESGFALRSSQVKVGPTDYRIYYMDSNLNISWRTSTNGLPPYGGGGVAIDAADANQFGVAGWQNSGYWKDTNTGFWWAVVDAYYGPTGNPKYLDWLFKSTDGGNILHRVADTFITGLAPVGQLYGSPRAFWKQGSTWNLIYLIGVPSTIWHSASPDMYNWYRDTNLTLNYSPTQFGLTACDQSADPCIIQDVASGSLFVYYDGTDNVNQAARIGMAIFPGQFTDYAACLHPTATPTSSPFSDRRRRR